MEDSDFEQSLYKALAEREGKSDNMRLLDFLNQPFVLWLLSATVLSVAAAYYSTYRECHIQADKIYDGLQSVGDEIDQRIDLLATRYLYDSELDRSMFIDLMTGGRYINADYKSKSVMSLVHDYSKLHDKIVIDKEFASDLMDVSRFRKPSIPDPSIDEKTFSFYLRTPAFFEDIKRMNRPAKRDDPKMALFTQYLEQDDEVMMADRELRRNSKPQYLCGFLPVFRTLLTGIRADASVILHPTQTWQDAHTGAKPSSP